MLHYDGELDPTRAREVERLLATDPEARRLLAQLEGMGSLLREADAARPATPNLTSLIMGRVFAPPAPLATAPTRALPWAFGGVALAAALALVLGRFSVSEEQIASSSRTSGSEPTASGRGVPDVEMDVSEESVALESVDFGSSQGAIFLIPTATSPMLVVWTLDDDADKGRDVDL
jgi:anti-sigma factor RsiW